MIIVNRSRFRFLQDRDNLYLLDLNSHPWSCLLGAFNWQMKMKAYKVDSIYGHDRSKIEILKGFIWFLAILFLIFSESLFPYNNIEFNVLQKIMIDIITFLIIFLVKTLFRSYETRKMESQTDTNSVVIKLQFRNNKKVIKNIIISEVLSRFVLGIGLIIIYITVDGADYFYFINVLGIWFFLNMGELVKMPFDHNDLRYIEEIRI